MNTRPNQLGDFEDPLENYDPAVYEDSLEQALAEEPVSRIQHSPHASVAPETTVAAAVQKMADENLACLTVEEDGKLLGLFTHREVLNQVALEPGKMESPVSQLMTVDPVYVYADDAAAAALSVMAVSGHRHVPVLGIDERVVGIISPNRVTGFLSSHFDAD